LYVAAMLIITIIKWVFVIASLCLSFWLFKTEQEKIRQIRKKGVSLQIVQEFQGQLRRWTQLIMFIFLAFLIWMLSYDFVVEDVSTENKQLSEKLEKVSLDYASLEDNRQRLLKAQSNKTDFSSNIIGHYTRVFTNYYLMRKCKISGQDDVFIINSAMMREITLNNLNIDLRKQIIDSAKKDYKLNYKEFSCDALHGRSNEVIREYQSYIIATREVLKSTF
jgi:hypothetical protein